LTKDKNKLEPKPVKSSCVTLSQLMQPEHANLRGDVHGGWIMKLVDEAGALAAMRHSQCRVVTVAIDQMTFHEPIRIGDLVMLNAELTYVGRTSMEARVEVIAEDPVSGTQSRTNTAYAVYVALDDERKPRSVPPLIAETDQQKRRMSEGKERQARRLANRKDD
jgi:uncharacterized protein (TIGR00369 family)